MPDTVSTAAASKEEPSPPFRPPGFLGRVLALGRDIKLSNSVFALPFALLATFMAAAAAVPPRLPSILAFTLIVVCMVTARTMAMTVNRLADARIDAANPRTAVVILSMHQDESYVLRALKAGAKGYLLKDSLRSDILDAIHAVSQGRSFLTRKISRMMQEDYVRQMECRGVEDSYDLLTDREREILQLVAEGKANKEVAGLLNISLTTVETHRTHILQKLGLHSVPDLILYAVRKNIIS